MIPAYYTPPRIVWHYMLRIIAFAVLFFLITPILITIPLSFNAEPFFSFTEGMLRLDPDAYSTRWYQNFFTDDKWQIAVKNSLYYACMSTILATVLGTLAAIGLSSAYMPFKSMLMALIISPMIVPLIIIAAGMYFFYSFINITGSDTSLIIAHAVLGVPFVVITVTASLVGLDTSLLRAASSLGAGPVKAFFTITFPLIRPGIISGALFAFVTSFDEVILIIFLASPEQRTIPRQMFSGLREQINPTILAAASLLILVSILLLITIQYISRKNAQRMIASE